MPFKEQQADENSLVWERTDYHRVCWENPILVHPQTTHSLSVSCVCCSREFCLNVSTYLIGSVFVLSLLHHTVAHWNCIVFPGGERNCGVHELICVRKGRADQSSGRLTHYPDLTPPPTVELWPSPHVPLSFFQAVLSSLCRCLLDVLTVFVFCVKLLTESPFLPGKQQL